MLPLVKGAIKISVTDLKEIFGLYPAAVITYPLLVWQETDLTAGAFQRLCGIMEVRAHRVPCPYPTLTWTDHTSGERTLVLLKIPGKYSSNMV